MVVIQLLFKNDNGFMLYFVYLTSIFIGHSKIKNKETFNSVIISMLTINK